MGRIGSKWREMQDGRNMLLYSRNPRAGRWHGSTKAVGRMCGITIVGQEFLSCTYYWRCILPGACPARCWQDAAGMGP
jgi:hypothetical protein